MQLLSVDNLSIIDTTTEKNILKNCSFELMKNDFLGVVGESGSGKSMLMREILKVNSKQITSRGNIFFENELITESTVESVRGRQITMILQDGMTAFYPLRKMKKQFIETFRQVLNVTKQQAYELGIESLEKLNFLSPKDVLEKYPHELSGGMLQRCMIAIALVIKPKIIIADEPTTALDSISQMEVVKEFERIRNAENISFIMVSHDLGVVQRLTNRVLVMKDGVIVGSGSTESVFNHPQDEYTRYLVETRQRLSDSFHHSLTEGRREHARS